MRQDLTAQTINITGTDITFYAVDSTEYQFPNWGSGSDVIVGLKNESTETCQIIFVTPWTGHGVANFTLADSTKNIELGKTYYFSDFDPELFNQRGYGKSLGTGGYVYLNLDKTQDLYIALFKTEGAI